MTTESNTTEDEEAAIPVSEEMIEAARAAFPQGWWWAPEKTYAAIYRAMERVRRQTPQTSSERMTQKRIAHTPMWSPRYGIVCRCGWVAPMRTSDTEQLKDHAAHKAEMKKERACAKAT